MNTDTQNTFVTSGHTRRQTWLASLADSDFALPEERRWVISTERGAIACLRLIQDGKGDPESHEAVQDAIHTRYESCEVVLAAFRDLENGVPITMPPTAKQRRDAKEREEFTTRGIQDLKSLEARNEVLKKTVELLQERNGHLLKALQG